MLRLRRAHTLFKCPHQIHCRAGSATCATPRRTRGVCAGRARHASGAVRRAARWSELRPRTGRHVVPRYGRVLPQGTRKAGRRLARRGRRSSAAVAGRVDVLTGDEAEHPDSAAGRKREVREVRLGEGRHPAVGQLVPPADLLAGDLALLNSQNRRRRNSATVRGMDLPQPHAVLFGRCVRLGQQRYEPECDGAGPDRPHVL